MGLPPLSCHTLLDRTPPSQESFAFTLLQAQVDHLVGEFIYQATDWRALAAITAGGMTYRFGRVGAMAAGTGRLASVGISLGAEVTAFEMTNRSLSFLTGEDQSNPNLWRWEGQGGIRQGLLNSLVTFGTLKGAGRWVQGENVIVQHLLQDTGMVLGHQVSASFGITDRPQGTLAEQFLHAEATNLQLGTGMALAHSVAPGIQGLERGLDLSLRSTDVGARSPRPGEGPSPLQNGLQPAFAVAGIGKKDSEEFDTPKVFLHSFDDTDGPRSPGNAGAGSGGAEKAHGIPERIEQRYKIPFLQYLRNNIHSSDSLTEQDKDRLMARLINSSTAEIADELFFALMRHWVEQEVQPYQRGKVGFMQKGPILEVTLDRPLSELHLNYILHIQEQVKSWGLTLYETGEGGAKIRMPSLTFLETLMEKRFGHQALRFIPFEGEMPRDGTILLLKWGYRPIGLPVRRILFNGVETHPFQFALHDLYHLVKWAAVIPFWMQRAAALYYEAHRELTGESENPHIRFHSDWEMSRVADLGLFSNYHLFHLIFDYGKSLREDTALPSSEGIQALGRVLGIYLEKLEGFFPSPSPEIEAHRSEIQGILKTFFGQKTNF